MTLATTLKTPGIDTYASHCSRPVGCGFQFKGDYAFHLDDELTIVIKNHLVTAYDAAVLPFHNLLAQIGVRADSRSATMRYSFVVALHNSLGLVR